MATYSYALTTPAWIPASMEWGIKANVMISTSMLNGHVQRVEMPGSRWVCSLTYTPHRNDDRHAIEAFWAKVRGQVNAVTLWHLMRPAPRGTMRGSPTLGAQASAMTPTLNISGSGTLLAGDMLSVGGQLVMVAADALAGLTAVAITPPLRATVNAGGAVTWDKPTATFIQTTNELRVPWGPVASPSFSVDLTEVF